MIDIKTRLRDFFSVEMKVGFLVDDVEKESDFEINTWIFIPNSIDINASTYSKVQFYSDVKSKVRFITPVYLLSELVDRGAVPYNNLRAAMLELFKGQDADKKEKALYEYEFQLKMFMAIFRSAMRNCIHSIKVSKVDDLPELVKQYINDLTTIRNKFRELRNIIQYRQEGDEVYNYFNFSDEYLAYATLNHTFGLLSFLEKQNISSYDVLSTELKKLILDEKVYMNEHNYVDLNQNETIGNQHVAYRHVMLNKYIESDLALKSTKKRDGDGVLVQQIYYSLAAGLSMIFATIIAFSFQQRYGNFTMPLFVALVISYMLKDRIKELMRFYFAGKIGGKYFDHKTDISIKDQKIGWIKESIDFITDDKVPDEVLTMRNRSALLEVENKIHNEKIILYRKKVRLENTKAMKESTYSFEGINDILRFNLTRITQRMDNPLVPAYVLSENTLDGKPIEIFVDKVYYLNFILQIKYKNNLEYKRFRLVCQRSGIQKIEELPIDE
ncbi:hypothetical protein [Myroides injenensis]|uniref:hypothetical protein n=1 Tax=Myroides injenensis TaxID=1183151 RepID=UPI00028861CE|nr:hypothetical protein [Myroides injenensis]